MFTSSNFVLIKHVKLRLIEFKDCYKDEATCNKAEFKKLRDKIGVVYKKLDHEKVFYIY